MEHYYLWAALIILIYMTLFFLLAQVLKNNSIVDIGWGLGFIVVTFFTAFIHQVWFPVRIVMMACVTLWGARLSIYILIRNRGKGEDYRYKAWRDSWKNFVLRSYLQIFLLQGILMFIIALPVLLVNRSAPVPFTFTAIIGLILFITGFLFEVTGDYQLYRFKKDPVNKGRIITHGLWRYTRHPNYFGEAVIWWGIAFFALPCHLGWIALISPVIITLMLRYVSGVTMLEKKYHGRPDFEDYSNKTSAFIPWFPKKTE
jgi:steroid 5-alpha reductase family enzyme